MLIHDLDTPAVVIDLDRVERNLRRAQAYADRHGFALRPHIKTHKIADLARCQVQAGARGICCQKLGEAEVMAEAGITDILICYNILGRTKLERLRRLAQSTEVSVVADSAEVLAGLSAAFADAPRPLPVLVECDTGAHRCGVPTPALAVALAQAIDRAPGLMFRGLMTYPPAGAVTKVAAWLEEAVLALNRAGLPPAIVSTGGTPDLYRTHEIAVRSEHRPGTYIYSDRSLVACGFGGFDDCALRVIATVISRPAPDRAILDAGSKTLTSDLLGLEGYGYVVEYPAMMIAALSEEHGHGLLAPGEAGPKVGERVTVIPNYACVVSNLFDRIHGVRGERIETVFTIDARGKAQ